MKKLIQSDVLSDLIKSIFTPMDFWSEYSNHQARIILTVMVLAVVLPYQVGRHRAMKGQLND